MTVIEYKGHVPTESSLLQVAVDVTPDDPAWQWSEVVYCEGHPCQDVECYPVGCYYDENGEVVYPDYGEGKGANVEPCREFEEFCRFQVVATDKCSVFGNMNFEMSVAERAEELLLRKERHAVEATLWGASDFEHCNVDCALNKEPDILCPDPVDLLGGIALLEDSLWRCTDTPIIHVPRAAVNYICEYLERDEDGNLRTCLGSFVVPGVGYDGSGVDGADCPEGTGYLYGTGMVKYLKGDLEVLEGTNHLQNEVVAHAERVWGLWVEPCCGVKAVPIKYCKP